MPSKPSLGNVFALRAVLLIFFIVFLFPIDTFVVCSGDPEYTALRLEDPVDPMDGLDYLALHDGFIVPVDAGPYNAEGLTVSVEGVTDPEGALLDVVITVTLTTVDELPGLPPCVFLLFLDTDLDPATGASEPLSMLNGIGADWNLGFIAEEGEVTSTTLEKYNQVEGYFETAGGVTARVGPTSMEVEFRRSDIGDPDSVSFMAYLITEPVTDMIPNPGEEPPVFTFEFPPVAVIEGPASIDEGAEAAFDASASSSFVSPIVGYSWDLDGDGVVEVTLPDPIMYAQYTDDGVYEVGLTVETASGLTASDTHTLTIVNVPPHNLEIDREGPLVVGEESIFTGTAKDPGSDDLTFEWEFGDGWTAEGETATHTWDAAGDWTVILTVTDDDGGTTTTEIFFTMEEPPPPPLGERIHLDDIVAVERDRPRLEFSFDAVFSYDDAGTGEAASGILKMFIDDSGRTGAPFYQAEIVVDPGGSTFTTPTWVFEPGLHVGQIEAEFEEGVVLINSVNFEAAEKPLDLLPILVFFFGVAGVLVYLWLTRGDRGGDGGGKKEDDDKEKDWCEEHPEVVKAEESACFEAQMDFDDALQQVKDSFAAEEPKWRQYSREVGRLMGEWDTMVAVIASLTESEQELYKDAGKVQEVAGVVTSASSKAKTAFKKGGEAAMKEVGKDFAKDVAKGIAGELSQFAGDLLSLEEWAKSTIGIGIAKGLTGIDPKGEATKLRKKSEEICTALRSWVDSAEARFHRQPPDTLHSCVADMEGMLNDLSAAEAAFNEAVKDFRCVTCEIPAELMKEMGDLIRKLNDYMKAFGDMIDQVEQRLNQAIALYNRKDVYDGPFEWVNKSRRHTDAIRGSLGRSAEAKGN